MWVEWWGRWSDWPMTWCIQCYISSWNNHYKDMDESHCHIGDLLSSPVPRVCSCHSLIYWTNFHRWYTSGWHCLKSNKLITKEKKSFLVNWDLKWGWNIYCRHHYYLFIAESNVQDSCCTKQLSKVFCTHFSISLTAYNSWHVKWCSSYFSSARKQILELLSIHSKIFLEYNTFEIKNPTFFHSI